MGEETSVLEGQIYVMEGGEKKAKQVRVAVAMKNRGLQTQGRDVSCAEWGLEQESGKKCGLERKSRLNSV